MIAFKASISYKNYTEFDIWLNGNVVDNKINKVGIESHRIRFNFQYCINKIGDFASRNTFLK